MLHASSIDHEPAEPGIHPVAAEIRDIILSKAAEGEPAMEEDFEHLTVADIKAHFSAGRAAAHKMVVRQLDDDRGFETRAQLLSRATHLLLGRMPDAPNMHALLRSHGIGNKEIADLWPDLLATVTDAFRRLHATAPGQRRWVQ